MPLVILFTLIGFFTDVSTLKRKKSKKKRCRSKDNTPDMVSNVHLQNSVDNNTVHRSPEHHSDSKTDKKHVESPAKLVTEQKLAKKKRSKTDVEAACGAANSKGDATSEAEKRKHKSVGSLDADPCSHHQTETRPESGIKFVVSVVLTCLFFFGL